ncbi:MAG: hypothetical protein HXX19_06930 [Rhodoferax sp.]|nr:hypothetical protein [Rhodoferax sp.]
MPVHDLKKWDFAVEFTIAEVAALIAGFEPGYSPGGKESPIYKRLEWDSHLSFFGREKWQRDSDGQLECLADRRVPMFSRTEIIRWLNCVGLQSEYQFDAMSQVRTEKSATRWPWGNHHTETLGHLEAAAKRFWANYDPADFTTANTNSTVSEWLQSDRKVSKTMADSIASMLRPDGLPTGPRK